MIIPIRFFAYLRGLKLKVLQLLKGLIIGTRLEPIVRKLLSKPKIEFKNSPEYWEASYILKGNSGSGSYGRLAKFKAYVLNKFVELNKIKSIVEFGCGDGNQLTLANYPKYIGLDISLTAVQLCKDKFKNDLTKSFHVLGDAKNIKAELSISLDVIYHLVEDEIYHKYMNDLFLAGERYVCIYSSNCNNEFVDGDEHIRHREFTEWVKDKCPEFELISYIPNRYKYNADNPINTSFANFFIFKRVKL